MKNFIISSLGSLVVAGAASAAFTGVALNEYVVGDKCVADIYMTFDGTNGLADVLLNIYNVQFSLTTHDGNNAIPLLIHSNLVPGPSWSPQFVTPGMENMDTFVTIGGAAGFNNSTQADPNWGGAGFNQAGIPALAGWFNSNPPNLQGQSSFVDISNLFGNKTYQGAATFVMRLVALASDLAANPVSISFSGSLTYNQGLGTAPIQPNFSFQNNLWAIPAPGALTLLALAGLAAGRRRRA
ncbi:MAG TPA: hypothetical protein PKC43_01275 [Phycisphaerales bacterium]|nr:hypothetical protein [Phycisphaerales bacterium]HMP36056.1 hypothetical protein [Phycisphaerales bacterium]